MTQELQLASEVGGVNTTNQVVHSVIRFLWLLRRQKAILMASLALSAILGVLYFGTTTRVYQAKAQILVQHSQADSTSVQMVADRNTQDQMATFERLFTSAVVLERALSMLESLPPEIPRSATCEKAIEELRDMLSVQALRRTSIIELSCRSEDPDAAVYVVNAVVASYLAYIDETHKSVSAQVVGLLQNELHQRDQQLFQSERELVTAKQNCADLNLDSESGLVHPSIQNVITYNDTVLKLQQRRVQLSASLDAIRTSVQDGGDLRQHLFALEPLIGRDLMLSALGLSPDDTAVFRDLERKVVEQQGRLNALLEHYGENHPQVRLLKEQIDSADRYGVQVQQELQQRAQGMKSAELGSMLLQMVGDDLERTKAEEQQMMQQYRLAQVEARQLITERSNITILERDLESLRELKANLISRIGNLEINQNNVDVRVSVVSHPNRPDEPVSPQPLNVAVFALLAGSIAGAGIVYIVDVIDDHFRSPEELQNQLGVPVLAMVRKHEIQEGVGVETLLVHRKPEAVESEAFRTLRTTLAFSGQDVNRLVVTSSEPSDGKTTVMANLGVSYAQSGKRVLLIDCDLRRPGLTNMFSLRKNYGVAEILRSQEDVSDLCRGAIVSSGVAGLELLPSGRRPPDPAELLSRDRFAELIAWAETEYDHILFDTPPVLAAADAAIIGRLVDGMVVVVQPQKNHRRRVVRAFEGLAQMGLHVLGVVVNALDDEDGSSYYGYGGYGYGYGYGYGSGYGDESDEELDDATLPPHLASEPAAFGANSAASRAAGGSVPTAVARVDVPIAPRERQERDTADRPTVSTAQAVPHRRPDTGANQPDHAHDETLIQVRRRAC